MGKLGIKTLTRSTNQVFLGGSVTTTFFCYFFFVVLRPLGTNTKFYGSLQINKFLYVRKDFGRQN